MEKQDEEIDIKNTDANGMCEIRYMEKKIERAERLRVRR